MIYHIHPKISTNFFSTFYTCWHEDYCWRKRASRNIMVLPIHCKKFRIRKDKGYCTKLVKNMRLKFMEVFFLDKNTILLKAFNHLRKLLINASPFFKVPTNCTSWGKNYRIFENRLRCDVLNIFTNRRTST